MATKQQLPQVEVEEEKTVTEDAFDVIEIVGDIISVGIGTAAGASVAYGLDKVLPVAETITEKAMRGIGIFSAGVTAQWLTSSAIADDIDETRMALKALHGFASNGRKKLNAKKQNN